MSWPRALGPGLGPGPGALGPGPGPMEQKWDPSLWKGVLGPGMPRAGGRGRDPSSSQALAQGQLCDQQDPGFGSPRRPQINAGPGFGSPRQGPRIRISPLPNKAPGSGSPLRRAPGSDLLNKALGFGSPRKGPGFGFLSEPIEAQHAFKHEWATRTFEMKQQQKVETESINESTTIGGDYATFEALVSKLGGGRPTPRP